MKALIRNKGEVITDNMGIPGIEWNSGYPLTSSGWSGGPYILVNDYVTGDHVDPTPSVTVNPGAPVPVGDIIVIDGVTYTRTS